MTAPALPAEPLGTAPGRGRMAGRRALVIGGGQRTHDASTDPVGNGRAIAQLLGREGAQVAVADRDPASAAETVARIAAEGGTARAFCVDVTQETSVIALLPAVTGWMGGLDALAINVGITEGPLKFANCTADVWERTLAVNTRGPMFCLREALPCMTGGGAVVLISSVAAQAAGSRRPAYDASKAALGGLMRHAALEGARQGVRVNSVCPGIIDTPMGRDVGAAQDPSRAARVPLGRFGTGWDVAYATLFLLSNEAHYINAQTLSVDGGLTDIS